MASKMQQERYIILEYKKKQDQNEEPAAMCQNDVGAFWSVTGPIFGHVVRFTNKSEVMSSAQ